MKRTRSGVGDGRIILWHKIGAQSSHSAIRRLRRLRNSASKASEAQHICFSPTGAVPLIVLTAHSMMLFSESSNLMPDPRMDAHLWAMCRSAWRQPLQLHSGVRGRSTWLACGSCLQCTRSVDAAAFSNVISIHIRSGMLYHTLLLLNLMTNGFSAPSFCQGVLLDQYGCLHDGQTPYAGAIGAVRSMAERGLRILLVSNSSRRAHASNRSIDQPNHHLCTSLVAARRHEGFA